MLIHKDNDGNIPPGRRETYFSGRENVNVSVIRSITTIATQDRKTGAVESRIFLGKALLPPAFYRDRKRRTIGGANTI